LKDVSNMNRQADQGSSRYQASSYLAWARTVTRTIQLRTALPMLHLPCKMILLTQHIEMLHRFLYPTNFRTRLYLRELAQHCLDNCSKVFGFWLCCLFCVSCRSTRCDSQVAIRSSPQLYVVSSSAFYLHCMRFIYGNQWRKA
jgi:hypothetical protein